VKCKPIEVHGGFKNGCVAFLAWLSKKRGPEGPPDKRSGKEMISLEPRERCQLDTSRRLKILNTLSTTAESALCAVPCRYTPYAGKRDFSRGPIDAVLVIGSVKFFFPLPPRWRARRQRRRALRRRAMSFREGELVLIYYSPALLITKKAEGWVSAKSTR
jgi:hypothetical protein